MENIVLIFFTSFVIALSGALMPGPVLTVTIAHASDRGFWVGPLIVLGHGLLELALIFLILIGLGPILRQDNVIAVIGLVGGLVLWWLGIDMVRSAGRVKLNLDREAPRSSRNSMLYGVLASLSNPFWTLWWATIGLGYLAAAWKLGLEGVLVFFAGHILADLVWYSGVSFAVSRGRPLVNERVYQGIMVSCGLFLILFGLWFFYFGWKHL